MHWFTLRSGRLLAQPRTGFVRMKVGGRRWMSSESDAKGLSPMREPPKAQGSSFGARVAAFLAGAGLAGLYGYYQLSRDLSAATAETQQMLRVLRADYVESEQRLRLELKATQEDFQRQIARIDSALSTAATAAVTGPAPTQTTTQSEAPPSSETSEPPAVHSDWHSGDSPPSTPVDPPSSSSDEHNK